MSDLKFRPWPDLEVRETDHGRGVFALKPIPIGATIELAPLILVSAADHDRLRETDLIRYIFDAGRGRAAVGLGYTSLFNHGEEANAEFEIDPVNKQIRIAAIKPIARNVEILVDYGYHPAQPATWDADYRKFEESRAAGKKKSAKRRRA